MKKLFILIPILLLLTTCRKVLKDVNDYYPEVKTVSAVVLNDGSVEVKGEIIRQGRTDIDFIGFCMDTLALPNMLANQINEVSFDGNTFKAIYPPEFTMSRKYYFRTWASNSYGYAYGNVIFLDSIKPMDVTPPCTPTLNSVNSGNGQGTEQYYRTTASQEFDFWRIEAISNSNQLEYRFNKKPITGIYTTTTYSPPAPGFVNIGNRSGFTTGTIVAGAKVYVNQYQPDKWEITLCNAPIKYGSAITNFTTRFQCEL